MVKVGTDYVLYNIYIVKSVQLNIQTIVITYLATAQGSPPGVTCASALFDIECCSRGSITTHNNAANWRRILSFGTPGVSERYGYCVWPKIK